jgi:hypothetical protein
VLLLGGLYATFWCARSKVSLLLGITAVTLISAQLFLVEQSVFGIPVRIIAFVAGIAVLALVSARKGQSIWAHAPSRNYAGLWLLFCLGAFVASLLNGTFSNGDAVIDFVSRYGFALVTFAVIAIFARNAAGAHMVAWWLFIISLANLAAVIGQYFHVQAAFALHGAMFPLARQRELAMIQSGLVTTFGYLPGLSPYSISTGYVFACFGVTGIGLAFLSRSLWQRTLILGLALAAIFFGGFGSVSRSTLVVGAIVTAMAFFLLFRGRQRIFLVTACAALSIIALTLDVGPSLFTGQASRLANLSDPARVAIMRSALEFVANHPLIGGSLEVRAHEGINIGSHNFILNGMVFYGLLGTVPMLIFVFYSVRLGLRALASSRNVQSQHALLVGMFAGMAAYLLKSLLHNESLATSGIMYAMLAGVVVGFGAPLRREVATPGISARLAQSRALSAWLR